MRIAHNPQTGEYLGLQGGEWKPLRVASDKNGNRVFLGDNGWEPIESKAKPETPDNPKPDLDASLGRGLGFGARNVLEGLGAIPDALLYQPINAIGGLLGYNPGLQNPGKAVSDMIGLPEARTDTDRLIAAATRGAAATLPTFGIGTALAAASKAPMVADALTTAPVLQTASNAAGETSAELARQGGFGTGGQLAAGLAGGFAPGALSLAASSGIRAGKAGARALEALTPEGRKRIAAENLRGSMSDPDAVLAALKSGADAELVPGSKPTLAQSVDDSMLAVAEKGRANRDGGGISRRYTEQRDARTAELNDIADGVEARRAAEATAIRDDLGNLSGNGGVDVPSTQTGEALRSAYDTEYGAARARTRDAYADIDPNGTTAFDLQALRDGFDEVLPSGMFAAELPAPVRRIVQSMDEGIAGGYSATFRDLQDIRTQLTDLAASAKQSGDAPLLRIATGLKDKLDAQISAAAKTPGSGFDAAQASAFGKAKALRREQAERFEEGANKPLARGTIEDGRIADSYFRPGPHGGDTMRAFESAFRDSPEAMSAMREHILQSFRNGAMDKGELSAAKMERWIKAHSDALGGWPELKKELQSVLDRQKELEANRSGTREAFRRQSNGNAKLTGKDVDSIKQSGLSLEETDRVRRLQQDIARNKRMQDLSGVRGSPTAQNLATQAVLDSFLGKSLGRGSQAGQGGFMRRVLAAPFNRGAEMLFGRADEHINQILNEAHLDPKLALDLLENYKPFIPRVQYADIVKRLSKAAGASSLNGLLRRYAQSDNQ